MKKNDLIAPPDKQLIYKMCIKGSLTGGVGGWNRQMKYEEMPSSGGWGAERKLEVK
jgi:hypothetical protein